MTLLKDLIDILFYVFTLAIVIRAIASWFAIRRDNPLMVILYQVTEPILAPLRRIIPMMGMFDITPIVAIILLQVIRWALYYLLSQFWGHYPKDHLSKIGAIARSKRYLI